FRCATRLPPSCWNSRAFARAALPSPARTIRVTDRLAGPTIGSSSSFLPLKRRVAERARRIAPPVTSSNRFAAEVSTASSQTPTTTAPDWGWSGLAKQISITTSRNCNLKRPGTGSLPEIAIDRTSPQVNAGHPPSAARKMRLARSRKLAYDPRSMASLERYILRQCFGVMIFVTAALSAAIWLAQSLRLIDLIVNRGLSIEVFLYLALLILPRFLDIVLPI